MLWDGSFVYEKHEAKAYSMAWNASAVDKSTTDTLTVASFDSNPNNLIYTEKAWPPACNFTSATAVCPPTPDLFVVLGARFVLRIDEWVGLPAMT